MKKIGIVGGVSWLSTIEYYKVICDLGHRNQPKGAVLGPPSIPEFCIESLNINRSFNLRGNGDNPESWKQFEAYFRSALVRLEASGAEVALIASNTPHNRFKEITQGISIPIISIFDSTAKMCRELGINRALILGTAPTMESNAFADVLAGFGIHASSPKANSDQSSIIELINELQLKKGRGNVKSLHAVVNNYIDYLGKDEPLDKNDPLGKNGPADKENRFGKERIGVCLSCTELPLLFPDYLNEKSFEVDGILFLNTTVIHAVEIFKIASGISNPKR